MGTIGTACRLASGGSDCVAGISSTGTSTTLRRPLLPTTVASEGVFGSEPWEPGEVRSDGEPAVPPLGKQWMLTGAGAPGSETLGALVPPSSAATGGLRPLVRGLPGLLCEEVPEFKGVKELIWAFKEASELDVLEVMCSMQELIRLTSLSNAVTRGPKSGEASTRLTRASTSITALLSLASKLLMISPKQASVAQARAVASAFTSCWRSPRNLSSSSRILPSSDRCVSRPSASSVRSSVFISPIQRARPQPKAAFTAPGPLSCSRDCSLSASSCSATDAAPSLRSADDASAAALDTAWAAASFSSPPASAWIIPGA
mmetsp:Transcript_130545/g.279036  ORF Transcript_130545/g.279036 Transcript_130545/m.279036 type:complete len:317 (+) Transcript_130545:625-1575(+)